MDQIISQEIQKSLTPEQPALETQHTIAHSCAGFLGGFTLEHGRKPTDQEIWNHAIRSWRDLNPPVPAPETPLKLSTSLLSSALKRSTVALDDWLHVHAGDFCDSRDVGESVARIKEVGTVAYIADVQMQNRAALAGTTEVAEAKVVHTLNGESKKQRTDTPTAGLQVAQQDDWFKTSAELTAITYEMDVIHERYSGKEKRAEREELLTPLRLKCREIGERRQLLVTPHKRSI